MNLHLLELFFFFSVTFTNILFIYLFLQESTYIHCDMHMEVRGQLAEVGCLLFFPRDTSVGPAQELGPLFFFFSGNIFKILYLFIFIHFYLCIMSNISHVFIYVELCVHVFNVGQCVSPWRTKFLF